MVLATAGVGMLLSSLIAGPVADYFSVPPTTPGALPDVNWRMVFLVPVAITLVGALTFVTFFREKTKEQLDAEFGRLPSAADKGTA